MEKTMNYIEAMDFLEETKKYGSQLGLTSIQNLMAELGNVQDEISLVHIGGTNGKGRRYGQCVGIYRAIARGVRHHTDGGGRQSQPGAKTAFVYCARGAEGSENSDP